MHLSKLSTLVAMAALTGTATAGPVAYGICQAGCAGVAVACYTAAGAVFVSWPLSLKLSDMGYWSDLHRAR